MPNNVFARPLFDRQLLGSSRHFESMTAVPEATPALLVVIVAEDEALIRMMAVDALTEAGFAVVEAEHAAGALAILAAQPNGVHALFTDIHMPGAMDGLELAHHVHDHWPWITLIVASGKARPLATEMPDGSRFLSKPYNLAHVVKHVRELAAS